MSGDDTRKKRDHPHSEEEKSNKKDERKKVARKSDPTNSECTTKVLDIETGLHRLLQRDSNAKEYLSDNTYVTFRSGHAGDASALEALYRGSTECRQAQGDEKDDEKDKDDSAAAKNNNSKEEEERTSSLELWLSEAMGNEDTHPPFVFSILAEVSSTEEGQSLLSAAVLFTVTWEADQRVIRVEWCHVDAALPEAKVLARRMWLRLSALALMTGCSLWIDDNSPLTKFRSDDERTVST